MAYCLKRSLVQKYDSNDSEFPLKLMEKTTDGMDIGPSVRKLSPIFRGKNGFEVHDMHQGAVLQKNVCISFASH